MTHANSESSWRADLPDETADDEITRAVSARHAIARTYVLRLRRRHPEAKPSEVIRMLERHYATSISTAGALITVGTIAADVGISMIPVAGAVAAGAKSAGTQAAKATAKQAAKGVALGLARSGAETAVAGLLPAGDEQLQFELTAIFALAIADIHGMRLDKEQSRALVFGLTNERVSQAQIATMAADVAALESGAEIDSEGAVDLGQRIVAGRDDWSHWATTLADTLPAGSAKTLVQTIQTGQLNTVRETLSGRQQAVVEYGVGAVTGGITRFVFGREVVLSARTAFPEPPSEFPAHLGIPAKDDREDEERPRAVAALEQAAKASGQWIAGTAGAVGVGVVGAADSVGRKFRSVDLDGDGIPDEPEALSAVKKVGGAVAGGAGAASGRVADLFSRKKHTTN